MQRITTTTKAADLFGAGKHGFKDGNLALGIAPTEFNAEWVNGVQEELLNVIEAAGITPAAATRNQALSAINLLSGKVQSINSFAANTTLTVSDLGTLVRMTGAVARTFTLPSLAVGLEGQSIKFFNAGTADMTVQRAGADVIQINSATATSITLRPGDALTLIRNTATGWVAADGSANLKNSAQFAGSIAASGYQALPGGFILQWQTFNAAINSTTTVTLPIAFPNNNFGTVVTIRDNVANLATNPISSALPLSNSTFSLRSYYSGSSINNFCVSLGN